MQQIRDATCSSEGNTTRLESSNSSTTRIDSGTGDRENPAISLDESKPPDFGDPFENIFYYISLKTI